MGERLISADVGLGTAYERWAVYALLDRWYGEIGPHTALEGPVDGMAGMAGLHLIGLARRGVQVTVALASDEALDIVQRTYRRFGLESQLTTVRAADPSEIAHRFDMVLTYNALPLVEEWEGYLERMARLAHGVLVVSVTNPISYGVMFRRLQRIIEPGHASELFDHPSTQPARLRPVLARLGTVEASAYVDCPWWPDLFVPTGQTLLQGTLRRLPGLSRVLAEKPSTLRAQGRFTYVPEHFPLFPDQPGHNELNKALTRHPAFDGRGDLLGAFFGHHRAHRVRIRSASPADAARAHES